MQIPVLNLPRPVPPERERQLDGILIVECRVRQIVAELLVNQTVYRLVIIGLGQD